MKQDLIKDVVQGMLPYLNNAQSEKLQEVLSYALAKYEVTENQNRERIRNEQTILVCCVFPLLQITLPQRKSFYLDYYPT